MKKIKKALISVSDKRNLNFLIKTLKKHKIQIVIDLYRPEWRKGVQTFSQENRSDFA